MQLPINGLDFDEIKSNFISYLKTKSYYTDYNFEASGISSLMNLFAYIAHYMGYYIKMAYTESFIDGATKRESLMSKAKLNGYLPKGKRASRAVVSLQINLDSLPEPDNKTIIIPKYSLLSGINVSNDSRTFYNLEDVICHNRIVNGTQVYYTSPHFTVYEGSLKSWKMIVKSDVQNQRFVINDINIDYETLRVYVYPDSSSTNRDEYILVNDVFDINKNDKVFYLSSNIEGLYEIMFGNNIIGNQPLNNSMIEMVYLSTSGPDGNGCTKMAYQRPSILDAGTTGAYLNFLVTIIEKSSGGINAESIQSLRTNIPANFKRQKRVVTESDYKSIILDTYRDIDSINIWGGEKNIPPDYGSIYISIKPKLNNNIGIAAKQEINKLLSQNGVIGTNVKLIDPEYIDVQLSIHVKVDPTMTNKSNGEIQKLISNKVNVYNKAHLSKFERGLSNIDLLDYIKNGELYISRIYSESTISKSFNIVYLSSSQYLIAFGNQLNGNESITSSTFKYGGIDCVLSSDIGGSVFISNSVTKSVIVNSPIGEIDYVKGLIKLIIEQNITSSIDYGTHGTIIIYAKPKLPDIETYLYNIVNISSVKVEVRY